MLTHFLFIVTLFSLEGIWGTGLFHWKIIFIDQLYNRGRFLITVVKPQRRVIAGQSEQTQMT